MIGIQGENGLEEVTKSPPDTSLDANSTNAVENRVVTQAINEINSILDELNSDIGNGTVVTNTVNHATETEVRYFTVVEEGTYLININMVFVNSFTAMAQFNLHSPAYGNMLKITSDSMSNGRMLNGTLVKSLSANTRLSLRLYQTSNATQTVDTTYASFKVKKLK